MDRMKRSIMCLGLPVLIFGCWSCTGNEEQVAAERPTLAVEAMVLGLSDETMVKTYTGTLEGEKQAVIYAKIAEAVEAVHVREGQSVRAGQVMISLDRTGPSSRYREALSLYRNAEKNSQKMQYLFSEGAVSELQNDAARTNYEVAKAGFEAAEKLVEVQSPIDGVVTSLKVSRGDFPAPGQELATVATVDRLRVKFDINTADVRLVNEGDSVVVSSEAVNRQATGVIVAVARSADPTTRSFQVEAALDNPDGAFHPGMFVRIDLVLQRLSDIMVVPRGAVLSMTDQQIVYVVSGSAAHRRTVVLGTDLDGRVVISSGLAHGDTLIVTGQDYLEDGDKVNIVNLSGGQ